MNRLRMLIVDTSIVYRKIMTAALSSMKPKAVVHYATTAAEATEKLASGGYRMVMLDTNVDDILRLVAEICARYPHVHLVLMGRSTRADRAIAAKAADMGAHGYMVKPIQEDYETNRQAIHSYLAELLDGMAEKQTPAPKGADRPERPAAEGGRAELILIAASTGGPSAIKALLGSIAGACCPPPILIVQHMPAAFTKSLAESLGARCRLSVKEAEEDDLPLAGHVYIAPGGKHMVLKHNHRLGLSQTAFVNGVRPSADVLFASVAEVRKGTGVLAVILTGMGKDGADGVRALKAHCDCTCVVQSRESCVVFGMPREVLESGLADSEEALPTISDRISKLCDKGIADDDA